ncbi:MAG TPA: hypothetical protein VK425_01650, partial [Acidimicrobiales bacterium]|nr:hypothetical protein [Acidimicrobiales bacterium]
QPSISTECYAGAGLSAEWIVEAPSSPTICNGTCDLAPYSPPVSFSSPSYTPDAYTQLDNITMTQNNTSVSQPSAVSSWPSDFTVQSV